MKKLFLSVLALLAIASTNAQHVHSADCAHHVHSAECEHEAIEAIATSNKNVKMYDFKKFKLHVYVSPEAMGDVTMLIEGKKSLVILEPQSFFQSIKDLNSYIAELGKPIEKIVANYHAGGLAECDIEKVVMVEPMVEFMKSPMAQGMMKKFAGAFQGAMDTRSVEVKNTIPAEGKQKWAGINFIFNKGAESDFPASNVNIADKVFYTHFAPSMSHMSPMQINSVKAIDATLDVLRQAEASKCEIFVGSHGDVASMKDVKFQIAYLEKMKSIMSLNKSATTFVKALKAAYPSLSGKENIEEIAAGLYK